jgi:hypothetical protein
LPEESIIPGGLQAFTANAALGGRVFLDQVQSDAVEQGEVLGGVSGAFAASSVQDLAYLYAAYASDKVNGTSEASNFRDAVRQHRLIDEIYKMSADFFG